MEDNQFHGRCHSRINCDLGSSLKLSNDYTNMLYEVITSRYLCWVSQQWWSASYCVHSRTPSEVYRGGYCDDCGHEKEVVATLWSSLLATVQLICLFASLLSTNF